ncbi:MAG: hypothetical protein AB1486_25420 [Planctomycetota bacterium]
MVGSAITFLACGLVLPLVAAPPRAQEPSPTRSAREILQDWSAVPMPSFSDGNSPEAIELFKMQIEDGMRRYKVLALELFEAYPDHARVAELMSIRWAGMNNTLNEGRGVAQETETLLGRPDLRSDLREEALLARARAAVTIGDLPLERHLAWIGTAITEAPEREEALYNLMECVRAFGSDPAVIRRHCERVLHDAPDSEWAAAEARGLLRDLERLAKLPDLDFDDPITREHVTTASLAGRPAIFMIWQGTSETQGRAFRELKRLRARHGASRLSVIGICAGLFQGDAETTLGYLKEHGVDWPHLIAVLPPGAAPWKHEWRVTSTPCFLIFDAQGQGVALACRIETLAGALARLFPRRPV